MQRRNSPNLATGADTGRAFDHACCGGTVSGPSQSVRGRSRGRQYFDEMGRDRPDLSPTFNRQDAFDWRAPCVTTPASAPSARPACRAPTRRRAGWWLQARPSGTWIRHRLRHFERSRSPSRRPPQDRPELIGRNADGGEYRQSPMTCSRGRWNHCMTISSCTPTVWQAGSSRRKENKSAHSVGGRHETARGGRQREETTLMLFKGLTEQGFVVDISHDGEDALEQAPGGAHDLIILDLNLPLRSGWSVLTELRRKAICTPVLVLTANSSIDHRVQGARSGRRRLPDQAVFFSRTRCQDYEGLCVDGQCKTP